MIRYLFLLLYSTSIFAHDYQFGVALIFRDEAPYLKEWIEYHRLVGAEHFWLYNNLSKDEYKEVLQPYVEEGIVDLIDIAVISPNIKHWNDVQTRAYNRALASARGKCKWLAVIDADEFVVPVTEETVTACLKKYEDYPGVAIHWMIFGTSLVEKIPEGNLMIETLKMRGDSNMRENRFVKLIVQTDKAISFDGPHMCAFKNMQAVSTLFVPIKSKQPYPITHEVLRINHYWSRDLDYLKNVKIPRSRISGGPWSTHMQKELELFNVIEDDVILRFVPALKERMKP